MPKAATRARLLAAARDLLLSGAAPPSAGAVANRAGVSRLTIYQHFGSYPSLLAALGERAAPPAVDTSHGLEAAIVAACDHWAGDPALFRRLPAIRGPNLSSHELASALASADRLRPGCSIREAEDVIAVVTSFEAFDRLHHDGRRSPSAVAEILTRMASSILAS